MGIFEIVNQFCDSKKEAMGKGWGNMQQYTRNRGSTRVTTGEQIGHN